MSHYKPKPRYLNDDASRHARSLYDALRGWAAEAVGGQKRHRLESPTVRGVQRADDTILCDCAHVLSKCPEWEGALMASEFAKLGWPVDLALAQLCHQWSRGVMDRVMAAHRNRSATLNPDRR